MTERRAAGDLPAAGVMTPAFGFVVAAPHWRFDDALARLGEALFGPFLSPASRTWWVGLVVFAALAVGVHLARGGGRSATALLGAVVPERAWRSGSAALDVQLLVVRRLLAALAVGTQGGLAVGVAAAVVHALDGAVGAPDPAPRSPLALAGLSVAYSACLFVAWDLSRFLLHRLMHAVPALWRIHEVHHSAEVLTPLTFHRIHPLESALYTLRGAVVTGPLAGLFFWAFRGDATVATLLGVHVVGLALNVVWGNARHSHVWLPFPAAVERWFLSPAQHQIHHGQRREEQQSNFGTWLALWDRAAGTWRPSSAGAPAAYGLAPADRVHAPDDLLGALLAPVRGLRPARGVAAASVGLLASGVARAEPAEASEAPADAAAEDDEDIDPDSVITVIGEARLPRVAGSAHVIDEEELQRWQYDDIHRALSATPGVYLRGEDGFGLRPNIGLRGANSDRSAKVALFEDGVLFGPAPYAAPAAYYFPMTQRLVGIEVFKGPAATRFGPQTTGGAINVRTRPLPEGPVGQLEVAAGHRSTLRVHGVGGAGGERWGLLLEGIHLGTRGFKQLDDARSELGAPTGFERQELMLKAGVRAGGAVRHTVQLKAGYSGERSDETYVGLTLDDFAATPYRRYAASALDQMRWHRTQAELSWVVKGDAFDVRTVAYHHYLSRQWFKLNRFAQGPPLHTLLLNPDAGAAAVYADILRGEADSSSAGEVLQVGTNDRSFHSFGLQTVAHWRATAGPVRSQLELGLRLHGDVVDRLHTEDPFDMRAGTLVPTGGDRLTLLDTVSFAQALAAHVHEDLAIGPLRLLPGVRVEVVRTGVVADGGEPEAPVTRAVGLPGLGVLVQALPQLDVFAGVHRGFSPVAPGQPADVRPELSWNMEAGGRWTEGGHYGELVGFANLYENITGACTLSGGCEDDQLDRQFNGGRALVGGLEASVGQDVRLPGQLTLGLQASYTLTLSRFQTGFVSGFPQFGTVEVGDLLPYVPVHQGAGRVLLDHPAGSFALGLTGRGAMRDIAGQGPIDVLERIPPAWQFDLAVTGHVTRWLDAFLTVTNLTNRVNLESFRPYGARPGAPIQAMAGVTLRAPG